MGTNVAGVRLQGQKSGNARGFAPQIELFGAADAACRYIAHSRVMATVAVRCLEIP